MFTMANSDYPNHAVLARDMHAHLRWRNTNARRPDVILAQRKERARHEARILVEVSGWPVALGALEWLLRVSGADSVEIA